MKAQLNSTGSSVPYRDSSASAAGPQFVESTSITGLPTAFALRVVYPVVTQVDGEAADVSETLLSGILSRYSRAWQILAEL